MHHIGTDSDIDVNLFARVYGEYIEMPGLQLTVAQASRLWNLTLAATAHVLDRLVEASFLRRAGDRYVRAEGPAEAGHYEEVSRTLQPRSVRPQADLTRACSVHL